ncbi:hypothetical protein AAHE18_07G056100 [Arachis hypogaea]
MRAWNFLDKCITKQEGTPTRNTVLHVAALYGNDEKAYCVARQEPDLVVFFNENQDTPLHVAARAGHFSIIKTLLDAYWVNSNNNVAHLLQLLKMKNRQGNTMLHEAIMSGSSCKGTMIFDSCYEFALYEINYEARSVLYLAVECKLTEAVYRILDKCPENATPKGISPLVQAIMGRDKEMLTTIADKKEECIHLREWDGRLALHVAAETGYHEGVVYLLERCKPCSIRRDILGFLPLHLAARHGHLEVVKELLGYCPDLDEMLDAGGNNILHIAAKGGELNMVNFILQTPLLEKMINQRNIEGETPLHVATSHGEAKIVHALTWDNRVDLNVVNSSRKGGQTPLDIANRNFYAAAASKVAPFERQSLTWMALISAGAKGPQLVGTDNISVRAAQGHTSVAACLAVPGEADGAANNLHKAMFHLFIFCITVSMFTSTAATIILIWGRLGVVQLLNLVMVVALPLLGTAVVTLFLAFMAGIYTVISKLTWLATTFLIITCIFVAIICVLFFLLFLPTSCTGKISRYISYYPFIFLASLAEKERQLPLAFVAEPKE